MLSQTNELKSGNQNSKNGAYLASFFIHFKQKNTLDIFLD